jgi:hypothetical protein
VARIVVPAPATRAIDAGARRMTNPRRLFLSALVTLAIAASFLAERAMALEEPSFTVEKRIEEVEIRRYAPYVVAEVLVEAGAEDAGSEGFRLLAGYIFGKNKGERRIEMTAPVAQTPVKIAMTAPVTQTAAASGHVVQFTMPAQWTLDTLPEPQDARVKLRAVPARRVAVIMYSGLWSQSRFEAHLAKLRAVLKGAGLESSGEPTWARYNPPWTPWFMRRNEIWLELKS